MENKIQHVAIIPDGNRRWARQHAREALLGHEAGAQAIETVLREALRAGVRFVTIWGLSIDNITKRAKPEVNFLFALAEKYFKKLRVDPILAEKRIKVRILGKWAEFFPKTIQSIMQELIDATAPNGDFNLTFLMAYSGTEEMVEAVRKIAAREAREKGSINAETIKDNLWTRDLPPVDVVIRTGGEPHWSGGFMMWSVADAQFYFTETLWPDFGAAEFRRALQAVAGRERRRGK